MPRTKLSRQLMWKIIRILLAILLLPLAMFVMQLGEMWWSHLAQKDRVELSLHNPEHVHWGFYPDRLGQPQVLLIGDSIAGGYFRDVAWKLTGVASVDTWLTPWGEHEEQVLADLKAVLSHRQYEVIHFNIGLHALGVTPEESLSHVKNYLAVIKKHSPHASIIWASTTPVTVQGNALLLDEKLNSEVVEKNNLIAAFMHENGVLINDLYTRMAANLTHGLGDRFHWNGEGSVLMSTQTVAIIRDNLPPNYVPPMAIAEIHFLIGAVTLFIALWIAGFIRFKRP